VLKNKYLIDLRTVFFNIIRPTKHLEQKMEKERMLGIRYAASTIRLLGESFAFATMND